MRQRFVDIGLYVVFVMLALVTYGYHYGWGSQPGLIPAIYHLMDPSYLANDLQASDYPVYVRAITLPIAQMAKVIPLPVVFFLFQVISLVLLFYAVRKVAGAILPEEPIFGWFTVLVLMLVCRIFSPGTNLIIGTWRLFEVAFYMYTLGFAVSLLALVTLAKERIVWTGIIAVLVLYIQLNHGEQILLILLGAMLIAPEPFAHRLKHIGLFVLVVAIIGAPILIPAISDQFESFLHGQRSGIVGVSNTDILRFRHSYHLEPSTWPLTHHLMFLLQIVGTWFLFRLRERVAWENIDRVSSRAFVSIIALCAVGYVNEFLKVEFIDKSYLFRTSVLSAIITVAYSCWALWHFGINRISRRTLQRVFQYGLGALTVYTVAAFVLNCTHPELFTGWRSKICPGITFTLQMTPLEEYIRDNTPRDAVFLVAPDYRNFAVNASRAAVVNWVAFPYPKDNFRLWYERIVELTDGKVTIQSMRQLKDSFIIRDSVDMAYYRLPPEKVLEAAKKYHASYCVFTESLPLKAEYKWDNLALYKIE